MLTIHHLGQSQSERIVWLAEELGIPYRLERYQRDATTRLAPPELAAIHPLGAAPVIADGDVVLAESGAVTEYLLARHGNGRLAVAPGDPGYAAYLYWLHLANGTLQPHLSRFAALRRASVADDHPAMRLYRGRLERLLGFVDARLAASAHLGGPDFTAADIMAVFPLTTMRLFAPFDLAPYGAIRAWLSRIGERPAYRRAMAAGDPGFEPMLA